MTGRTLIAGLALLLLTQAGWAGSNSYYLAEKEIREHDRLIGLLAQGLESWLAGRISHQQMSEDLKRISPGLGAYKKLPGATARAVQSAESDMLEEISTFINSAEPGTEGQKALFLALGRLTESRTLELLEWRQEKLSREIGKAGEQSIQYLRWEASWIPIWLEEARLTRELQQSFLQDTPAARKKAILQELLRLRVRADATACPPRYNSLDQTSRERLTVLARTAEQLLRLEEHQSQGAVSRVRRLSRQLSELTETFQTQRLRILSTV